jgi:hypothetical protein
MADTPVTTTTDTLTIDSEKIREGTASLASHAEAATAAEKSTKAFNAATAASSPTMEALSSYAAKYTTSLGLLATATLGFKDQFAHLNKEVDATKFNGITDQIKRLGDSLSLNQLKDLGKSLGVSESIIGTFTEKTIGKALEVVTNFAQAADSVSKFEQGMLDSAAKTGTLGKAYAEVGGDIAKFSDRVLEHQQMIINAARSAHLDPTAAQEYYRALRTIPGALEEMKVSTGSAVSEMSMLEATMHLARGTGMSLEDVTKSLKTAFENYNLTGEKSLLFTARISELSQKLEIPLHDVSEYVNRLADNFGMLGDQSEGTANILAKTFQSFRDSGLSAKQSISVIQGMTESVLGLNTAQRAFLSSQTGGSGGLMGSFQMLKAMREGKTDEIFDKVKQQMTRQMGPIVSLDQAASSASAAAQYQKQLSILQQGPLGKFAKDEATATRILDAFSKNSAGTKLDTSKFLDTSVSRAKEIESKTSVPLLEDANRLLGEIAVNTSANAHQVVTKTVTAFRTNDKDFKESSERSTEEASKKAALRAKAVGFERMKSTDIAGELLKSKSDFTDLIAGNKAKGKQSIADQISSKSKELEDAMKPAETTDSVQKKNYERDSGIKVPLTKSVSSGGETRPSVMSGFEDDSSRKLVDKPMSVSPERKAPTLADRVAPTTRAVLSDEKRAESAKIADKQSKDTKEGKSEEINVRVEGLCLDCGRKTASQHVHATTGHK